MESWILKIEEIAAEAARQTGCELYDLEVVGLGAGRTLRIFIDKPDQGVGIEDCSNVSHALNVVLDKEEIIPGEAYNLEVSSPGLDRHLKKLSHFQRAIGETVFIQLSQNLGSLGAQDKALQLTKKFEEKLQSVEGDKLVFAFKKETLQVPFELVEKAKVVFDFKQALKKSKD